MKFLLIFMMIIVLHECCFCWRVDFNTINEFLKYIPLNPSINWKVIWDSQGFLRGNWGALGWLSWLSVWLRLRSCHLVREFEPRLGLCVDNSEPGGCSDSVSPSLSAPPPFMCVLSLSLSFSLSLKNKHKKIKEGIEFLIFILTKRSWKVLAENPTTRCPKCRVEDCGNITACLFFFFFNFF